LSLNATAHVVPESAVPPRSRFLMFVRLSRMNLPSDELDVVAVTVPFTVRLVMSV
jgi:hypothetical protein